jgi:hypothetical protein
MYLWIFDIYHPFIKASFVTFNWVKWLNWHGMHFTCQTKVNDDMEFQYYKKFFKIKLIRWLSFATIHDLWLNGWNDMSLTTQ